MSNPFADPSLADSSDTSQHPADEDTLTVGRNASLTLGTDSLVVLDEGFAAKNATSCCGLLRPNRKTTRAIPFFNVLWAELAELDVRIDYAHSTAKEVVRVTTIEYLIDKVDRLHVRAWIARLLERAYGEAQRSKKIKVLINPFGGKGNAHKWYTRHIEPIFTAARCQLDVERTQFKGHAMEIAEALDEEAFDAIASCSGDGLPYEVFNGLGRKKNAARALAKVAVVQLPCGTGNAMSLNLNGTTSPSLAALCVVKGIRTPLDLVSITQGDTRTLSFLSQSVGIVAESDLGTEHLRFLGSARFTYGFLVRLIKKTVYPCDLAVKVVVPTKAEIRDHHRAATRARLSIEERRRPPVAPLIDASGPTEGLPELCYGSINDPLPSDWHLLPYEKLGNFYSGNMVYMAPDSPFFAASLPSDGCLDLVTIDGDISRTSAIQMMLSIEKNNFFDMPLVNYRKISGYRIIPRGQADGYISIDGERVPFAPFQAEVHRGLGTVLSKNGQLFEFEGVKQTGYPIST